MWKRFVSWAMLGLLCLPGLAWAQGTGAAVPAAEGASFALDAGERGLTLVRDPRDGSAVVWGSGEPRGLACVPEARAFVARQGEDGGELWRRDASSDPGGLFAGLTSFDPRHILTSTVREVAVDPITGQLYVAAEVWVAWRGGACEAGVATALGTLILALAPDGTPVRDVYLGAQPEGQAPAGALFEELCAADRLPQTIGRRIRVDAEGQVVVVGERREAAGVKELFSLRLSSDLRPPGEASFAWPSPVPNKVVVGPGPAPGPAPVDPQTICPPPYQANNSLESIRAVNATLSSSLESLYASDEGCVVKVTAEVGNPYGFITRSLVDANATTVHVHVHVEGLTPGNRLEIKLEDLAAGNGDLVLIREFTADAEGVVNVAFDFPEPGSSDPSLDAFINNLGEITMAVIEPVSFFIQDDDDEMECDMVQIDG